MSERRHATAISASPISVRARAKLTAMRVSIYAAVTDTTVPTTDPGPIGDDGFGASIADVVSDVVENLANNGYQTGAALVVATIAVVALLNIGVRPLILVPTALGAFWAGWLGWNTLTGEDNPLFPGDVEATKLWDVAVADDTGFLIVAAVACVAALFIWRTSISLVARLALLTGAVLGASFVYNLIDAVRTA